MKYLTNTFSPMMLNGENIGLGLTALVQEITTLQSIPLDVTSAISHEVTAGIISVLLGRAIPFCRVSLTLQEGDEVFCLIPRFRASEAREFSRDEVEGAGFRLFKVTVVRHCPYEYERCHHEDMRNGDPAVPCPHYQQGKCRFGR